MASIDFKLHKIFVEGPTDQVCLEKILELKYGILFPHNGNIIEDSIICCYGWPNLKSNKALTRNFGENYGGKNLVIFDADGKSNDGGYQKRYNQLLDIAKGLKVKFEIFLFPDNESDGMLEDFYCSCFKKEMKFFEECWQGMLGCLELSNNYGLKLNSPSVDDKVDSYIDLFEEHKKEKNARGKKRYLDGGLWEFDFKNNMNLKRLISFIENCSIITNE